MTVTAPRWLDVNDIPLDTHAWRVVEGGYDVLLASPALRGEDLIMHGARGVRPYPRIVTVTVVSVPLLIIGAFDQDGEPIADPGEGMLEHRDYLRHGLGIADEAEDADRGTVEAVFHRGGSLPDWVGPVTVLGLNDWVTLDLDGGDAMVRLDLSIPDGELEETGS